jgi:hypothetical protein
MPENHELKENMAVINIPLPDFMKETSIYSYDQSGWRIL